MRGASYVALLMIRVVAAVNFAKCQFGQRQKTLNNLQERSDRRHLAASGLILMSEKVDVPRV